MTKYLEKSFSVAVGGKAYSDGWEAIFTPKDSLEDLPEPEACAPEAVDEIESVALFLIAKSHAESAFWMGVSGVNAFALGAEWAAGWVLALSRMGEAIRSRVPRAEVERKPCDTPSEHGYACRCQDQ